MQNQKFKVNSPSLKKMKKLNKKSQSIREEYYENNDMELNSKLPSTHGSSMSMDSTLIQKVSRSKLYSHFEFNLHEQKLFNLPLKVEIL